MTQDALIDRGRARITAQLRAFVATLAALNWADRPPFSPGWQQAFADIRHGDWPRWLADLGRLPEPPADRQVRLDQAQVAVDGKVDEAFVAATRAGLRGLMPWRKGPYALYGIEIDTEWRSDWKWDRLAPHIKPLAGRRVLDVGSGSGYHLWRMRGAGAELAVGVDPTLLFVAQFFAVAHLLGAQHDARVMLLPTTLEAMVRAPVFDTVFSMGVLYHRRDPLGHLRELAECLRPGGELVLETLIVEGDAHTVLMPTDRYAAMRNVWFIPSTAMLTIWLQRLGFTEVRTVDVQATTPDEQRVTDWMGQRRSLPDFLDPDDPGRTIEGYPAPVRAILVANKPA